MTGRNKGRVDYCNSFDFVDKCISIKDEDYMAQLEAVKPALGFAHVVDCLGCDNYDYITSLMKSGGTIVALGMHAPQLSVSAMALYMKELSIRTGLYFSAEDYAEAAQLVCKYPDTFLPTISSKIPQDPEVVEKMFIKLFESGSNNECKVLLEYED